jgi:membrane associated rhomboid family serine protease
MMNMTETVKQLIIINVIFFVASYFVGQPAYDILALHYPENPAFKIWQPVTHMFMHGGIMHIFFNMFALYSFGSLLESIWGSRKFLFFYFSCGLGAALLHMGVNYLIFHHSLDILVSNGLDETTIMQLLADGKFDTKWEEYLNPSQLSVFLGTYLTPAVGASGAIYGTLVAFAFIAPNAELMMMFIPIPIKAKYFVPGLLAVDLFLGLKGESLFGSGGDGVAHFAHLGGALIGFIMMWYWRKNQFNHKRWN